MLASPLKLTRVGLDVITLLVVLSISQSAAGALYLCSDNGTKTYQDKPCAGTGKVIDATPANGTIGRQSDPGASLNGASTDAKELSRPATQRSVADDGIARYGLTRGMSVRAVMERWGFPGQLPRIVREPSGTRVAAFYHWCDLRIAMFIDGALAEWDAPLNDSKRGVTLFRYGEPWIRASQRWGYQPRKVESFSGPEVGRGEVHHWDDAEGKWTRWVMTDSHGAIVGWCERTNGRTVDPPTPFNPPWDNAIKR